MTREVAYLQIPGDYFQPLGLVYLPRWSAAGEAIEWPDETTLAFGGEVALFLEGYALVGPPIHFAHVVHLLQLFDPHLGRALEETPGGPGGWSAPLGPANRAIVGFAEAAGPLIRLVREAGRPMRNLGALSAWLCRAVPPLADPPDIAEIGARLADGSLLSSLAVHVLATSTLASESEVPAISAEEFAARFLAALGALEPAAIAAWLKHGRGAVEDRGDRLAEGIEAIRPSSLGGALASVASRERLSGSIPMVGPLVGALALPPRRLADRALPTGGYSDVGTRGRPEQILPSQFALDPDEFLRRFAANELLYFRREEPRAPLTEELVVLIDQGVRTWGKVRVALAAAALALGKLAGRRKIPLLVGSTGSGGRLLDPTTADPEELGRLWEGSDLSCGPAEALESALLEKGDGPRDVVVLAHPRGLVGPDFAAATRAAGAGTRVFSVSVDEPGRVEFAEWRRGVAVRLGEFRVDYSPPETRPRPSARDPMAWSGDVEPVGFPFRFGVFQRLERPLFDFDGGGKWLLLATRRGILHAWALDGSRSEVFPRAMVGGEVMEQVDAVLGVAGGFVVAGRFGKTLVAMHYDLESRAARAHRLGPTFDQPWQWCYAERMHTVIVKGKDYCRSVDLATGEFGRSRETHQGSPPFRARLAFLVAENNSALPPRVAIVEEGRPAPEAGRSVALDRAKGEVRVSGVAPPWHPFTPESDGLPSLRGRYIEEAQLRGGTLALLVSRPDQPGWELRLFQGPTGRSGRELRAEPIRPGSFMLSPDGALIACRLNERQVGVREAAGAGHPVFHTPRGRVHTDLHLVLGRYGMTLVAGRHGHLVRWDGDRLVVAPLPEGVSRFGRVEVPWPMDRPATRRAPLPPALEHDPHRFLACARSALTAVVDAYGQVALLDRGDRLVAMFVTSRSQVAAWMPDGTKFGLAPGPSLIDGPTTPDAARLIGRALKAASDEAIREDEGAASRPGRA